MTATRAASRRPHLGELVILKGQRFTIAEARGRGCWIRPAGAVDESRDRFFPIVAWSELRWDAATQCWGLEE